jgi:hypothetical protein
MSDQGGSASVTADRRSAPLAAAVIVLIGLLVAVLITTLTAHHATTGQPRPGGVQGPIPLGTRTPAPSSIGPGGPTASGDPSGPTAGAATTASPLATSAGLAQGQTLSGVAGVGTTEAAAFGTWRGKPVDVVVDYVGSRTWDGITQLSREGLLDRGLPASVHRVFSVPLIPTDEGATLAAGAHGDYDQHFRDLAKELIRGGQANATIRVGWEMTGDWFAWSGVKQPSQWVGAYQKAVTAMRSVPGADFTFDWTVALHQVDPTPMYPGDQYVDLIGADNYDVSFDNNFAPTDHEQVWNGILTESWGLNWLSDFASRHGKRISMGEWGVSNREDGHGGGDNPYFIEQMHGWFASHDVAYEAYFEATDPSVKATFAINNGQFPQAANRYRQLFGAGAAVPGTSPTVPTVQPSS